MANYCLLPDQIDNFRKALKERDLDMNDLLSPTMTSDKLTEIFKPYAGDNAKAIATLFEEKLTMKNRMLALENMVSKLGKFGKNSPEALAEKARVKAEYKSLQQERIFHPKEHQSFLNNYADKLIGTHVTQEQSAEVFKLTNAVSTAKETNLLSGVSPEYLKAKQELNNYINSIDAPSAMASIGKNLAIIGRNNLLANPATPLKSIEGQALNAATEAITRRLAGLSGKTNPELVKQANKEAWDTFKKTGVNTAAMESLDDTHVLGKGENFKLPPKPTNRATGVIEKVARNTAAVSNKIIIDWAHNISFTKFYQSTFFDTANINAGRIAKIEGLSGQELKDRAAEIFKDSVKVKPETEEGAMARNLAQRQAARVTSTNENAVSRFSLGVKTALNKAVPGLGDFTLPIAKIPAAILANGLDNAGVGIPFGVKDIIQGRSKMAAEDMVTKLEGTAQFGNGIQRLLRIAGTIGTAALLVSKLSKDDFREDKYGNSFVKIGNTWINTEYIAIISPALAGMMKARENGTGTVSDLGQYFVGLADELQKAPGLDEASTLATDIGNTNITKGAQKYVTDFLGSRAIPAFAKNLFKGRPIDRLFFGASGVESDNQYQQELKDKATQKKSDAVIKNSTPNQADDWSTSTSKTLKQFKDKIGDQKFQEANNTYNDRVNQRLKVIVTDGNYKTASDEVKQKIIDKNKTDIQNQIYRDYNFTYVKDSNPEVDSNPLLQ